MLFFLTVAHCQVNDYARKILFFRSKSKFQLNGSLVVWDSRDFVVKGIGVRIGVSPLESQTTN